MKPNRRQTVSHKARINGRGVKDEDNVKPSTLDVIKAMKHRGREAETELPTLAFIRITEFTSFIERNNRYG